MVVAALVLVLVVRAGLLCIGCSVLLASVRFAYLLVLTVFEWCLIRLWAVIGLFARLIGCYWNSLVLAAWGLVACFLLILLSYCCVGVCRCCARAWVFAWI